MSQPIDVQAFEPARRILIVRLSAHGDVMQTLPLLSAIKQADPTAHVGWLVEASAAPLLEGHPLIDRLHVSQRKRWLKTLRDPLMWVVTLREIKDFVQTLKQEGYTVSLDVQGLLKSAILPFLAGISQRYGFDRTRESAAVFYTHKLPPMNLRDAQTPAVERYLDFARALGSPVDKPSFVLPTASDRAEQKMAGLFPTPAKHPIVVLAPFTRWASKHWVPTYWTRLINGLQAKNLQVVMLGAPADQVAAQAILSALPASSRDAVLNLVGQTDWPDLYALWPRVALLIGPDSAPLHMANAAGVPVIGLFGPTAPGRTGPIGDWQWTLATTLDCQPCFAHDCPLKTNSCMHQLPPERVLAEVDRVLPLTLQKVRS